jgi:hypothetical protein
MTNLHEDRAKKEQLRRPPSRLGLWVLRRLGFRGQVNAKAPPSRHQPRRPSVGPPHKHKA